jgi:hypothetical protein
METKYPQYAAANGDVLPIDTSVDPASLEWEYYMVDQVGYADFVDDDGTIAPSSAMIASRHTGKMAEIGHRYDLTLFDLERAAKAGLELKSLKQAHAKKAHDAKTNWIWLFGESARGIPGLCNHPNINVQLAPLNDDSSSRLWKNKTADEIMADITAMVNSIAENTLEAYVAKKVLLPHNLLRRMQDVYLTTAGGIVLNVLEWVQKRYAGDPTGQGQVQFMALNECDGARRLDPVTNSDTSGITGDFCLVLPAASADELCFVKARPFTQLPPQQSDFKLHHLTHSKVGGCKAQIPLAVTRFDFGLT